MSPATPKPQCNDYKRKPYEKQDSIELCIEFGKVDTCAAGSDRSLGWRRDTESCVATSSWPSACETGNIDDGFWQGAPVGGFGSGTFSRTYRGDFARWHIKAGVHKYAPVYANQFAMFQQTEGEAQGTARVLMTDHPTDGTLASWQWDYPVGAGEYAALYPKSWYDYKWDEFPAHVVLEQFCQTTIENQAIRLPFIAGIRKILLSARSRFPSSSHGRTWLAGFVRLPVIFKVLPARGITINS